MTTNREISSGRGAYSGFPGCRHDPSSAFDGAFAMITSVVLITHLVFSATSNNNDNNDNNNNNNNNNVGQFNNAFVSMNENAATATGGNGRKKRKKRMTGRSGDPPWEGITRSIIRTAAEQMAESEVGLVRRYGEALLRS